MGIRYLRLDLRDGTETHRPRTLGEKLREKMRLRVEKKVVPESWAQSARSNHLQYSISSRRFLEGPQSVLPTRCCTGMEGTTVFYTQAVEHEEDKARREVRQKV